MRSLRFLLAALVFSLCVATAPAQDDRRDTQQRIVLTPDGASGDQVRFGDAVAFSADGAVAVIGAYQDEGSGTDSGAAYVYLRGAAGWTQIARLTPSTPQASRSFGTSVTTDADGSFIAVGASGEDDGRGAVYVYTRTGTSVTLDDRVIVPNSEADAGFGASVDVSDDGALLAVGAPGASCGANQSCGLLYLVDDGPNGWAVDLALSRIQRAENSTIGRTIAISGDGRTVITGDALEICEDGADATCGYALVFAEDAGAWTQQAELRPINTQLIESGFGDDVALSFDGSIALVGAGGYGGVDDPNIDPPIGRGVVFERAGETWSQAAVVGSGGSFLGETVDLSGDGQTMLLGADHDVFVYRNVGGTWTLLDRYVRAQGTGLTRALALADAAPGGPLGLLGSPGTSASSDRAVIFQIGTESAITVTEPARRVVWKRGATVSAAWEGTDLIGQVDVALVTLADSTFAADLAEGLPSTGSTTWTVPDDLATGRYRVRVTSALDSTFRAFSDRVEVQGATVDGLTLLSPTAPRSALGVGWSVSASEDGGTIWAGAPGLRGSFETAGRIYDYDRRLNEGDAVWREDFTLNADDSNDSGRLGFDVALSHDDAFGIAGEPFADCDDAFSTCGDARFYVRDADDAWAEDARLRPGDLPANTGFGTSVAISADGSVIAVSAPFADFGGDGTGSVYLFDHAEGSAPVLAQRIDGEAARAAFRDLMLGNDLALSHDGTRLVASAQGLACASNPSSECGGAIVYHRESGTWTKADEIGNDVGGGFGGFGQAVAMSGDGTWALVTAIARVYSYELSGGDWTYRGFLDDPADFGFSADFGTSAALSFDGQTALIGAPGADFGAGAVSVHVRDAASGWFVATTLRAFDADSGADFGYDVAISADAGLAFIGAPSAGSASQGHLYVAELDVQPDPTPTLTVTAPDGGERFTLGDDITVTWTSTDNATVTIELRDAQSGDVVDTAASDIADTGTFVWTTPEFFEAGAYRFRVTTQDPEVFDESDAAFAIVAPLPAGVVRLTASDGISSEQDPLFGTAVALSDDGTVALVGAPGDANDGFGTGAAYVLAKQGGDWMEVARLRVTDGEPVFALGSAVALSADGTIALVGAPGSRSARGAAFVFVEAAGSWVFAERLEHDGGVSGDGFGTDVALSADGMAALVASPNEALRGDNGSGAAYTFDTDGAAWGNDTPQVRFAEAVAGKQFGVGVALSSDGARALVAAGGDGGTGRAIFFDRSGSGWTNVASFSVAGISTNAAALDGAGAVALVGARNVGGGRGTAEVYVRGGAGWAFDQRLDVAGAGDFDNVGAEVALSRDGRWAIVSAPFADESRGMAQTFERGDAGWNAADRIQPPDLQDFDEFGSDVAISADGTEALAGARGVDAAFGKRPTSNRGALYVYESVALPSDVAGEEAAAEAFVGAPYPNPAAPGVVVRLALRTDEAQSVRATLYDALGRRLALVLDAALAPGDARSLAVPTARLAAGVYLLRVEGRAGAETRRFVVR